MDIDYHYGVVEIRIPRAVKESVVSVFIIIINIIIIKCTKIIIIVGLIFLAKIREITFSSIVVLVLLKVQA